MTQVFLFLFLISTLASAQSRCVDLFEINGARPLERSLDKAMLAQIDILAEQFLKLQARSFENANQHDIALSMFQNEMQKLSERIPGLKEIFKQSVLKKRLEIQASAQMSSKKSREQEELLERSRQHKLSQDVDLTPDFMREHGVFHSIAPGSFKTGPIESQVTVNITKPFGIMATLMTQRMWSRLKVAMSEIDQDQINPSHFKTVTSFENARDYRREDIRGVLVDMKPNHPVENISWDDVTAFLVQLNQLSKAKSLATQDFLAEVFPGHRRGDRYDMPTEAQLEFVISDRGRETLKGDSAELMHFAWTLENSGNETHEIATKKAQMIDGQPYYDLQGNIAIWVKDAFIFEAIQGGDDPVADQNGSLRVIRGKSWRQGAKLHLVQPRSGQLAANRSAEIGVRLVRTRP